MRTQGRKFLSDFHQTFARSTVSLEALSKNAGFIGKFPFGSGSPSPRGPLHVAIIGSWLIIRLSSHQEATQSEFGLCSGSGVKWLWGGSHSPTNGVASSPGNPFCLTRLIYKAGDWTDVMSCGLHTCRIRFSFITKMTPSFTSRSPIPGGVR